MLNAPSLPQHTADTVGTAPMPESGESAAPAAVTSPPRWSTQALMGSGREAEIAHGGSIYHLRITSLGRLILTK